MQIFSKNKTNPEKKANKAIPHSIAIAKEFIFFSLKFNK